MLKALLSNVVLLVITAALCGCQSTSKTERISLFNGKDLSNWQQPHGKWRVAKSVSLDPKNPRWFAIERGEGIFVNGNNVKDINFKSVYQHGDCEAHIEFCIPEKSNSGVYFQGRYEIQILDSWGVPQEKLKHGDSGGIYQRWKNEKGYEGRPPRLNASKKPGEWQTLDVVFRAPRFDAAGKKTENARFVKVVYNGKVVHENQELSGPTRSPMSEKEVPVGPLLLQGDHGPVAYRNMWLKPLSLE